MSATSTSEPRLATPPRPWNSYRRAGVAAALLVVGGVIGTGLSWMLRDPHTAKLDHLVGTVDWSNQSTNTISFRADGQPATGEQVFYRVLSGPADYPACLVAPAGDPVRQDKRRVELDALHASVGGKQPINIAVTITCRG